MREHSRLNTTFPFGSRYTPWGSTIGSPFCQERFEDVPSLGRVSTSTVGKSDIWASPGRWGKPPVPVMVKLPWVGRSRRTMQLEARRLSVSIRSPDNSVRLFWMKVVSSRTQLITQNSGLQALPSKESAKNQCVINSVQLLIG